MKIGTWIHLILFLVVMVVFSLPLQTLANVALKNGNFYMGYTDLIYPGGIEPKIERIYNSKSVGNGDFGWAWGTIFGTHVIVVGNSLIVKEFENGAENVFDPVASKTSDIDETVDMIAHVAQKAGAAGSASELASYRKKLKNDRFFRNQEWVKYKNLGKLQAKAIANGTQFQSNRFNYEYITKVPGGYIRNFDGGMVEKFDESGRMHRRSDKNGNFIDLTYGKDGHLQKLVDNFNRKIFFENDSRGLITKIEGEGSKKAEYKYNDRRQLISSRDVDGNTYTYTYDARHNMTSIGYSDKTSMVMTYYGRDKDENIKTIKDRDGTLTEYTYDSKGPDYYAVTVNIKESNGKSISMSKYEYFNKFKPNGEEWTEKMVTVLDGDRTETTYNECCGLPLVIKHGGEETTFQYDPKGRVTRKANPYGITELHYDANAGKVDRVTTTIPGQKEASWSQFQYDSKANLIFAKNSKNKAVKLVYDGSGRIHTLIDQDHHQISFKYNENSKPVEISDPSLGAITVTYTNSGEIKKVESAAGRKIAGQVTTSFRELLDIIRPAGVSLSF